MLARYTVKEPGPLPSFGSETVQAVIWTLGCRRLVNAHLPLLGTRGLLLGMPMALEAKRRSMHRCSESWPTSCLCKAPKLTSLVVLSASGMQEQLLKASSVGACLRCSTSWCWVVECTATDAKKRNKNANDYGKHRILNTPQQGTQW